MPPSRACHARMQAQRRLGAISLVVVWCAVAAGLEELDDSHAALMEAAGKSADEVVRKAESEIGKMEKYVPGEPMMGATVVRGFVDI